MKEMGSIVCDKNYYLSKPRLCIIVQNENIPSFTICGIVPFFMTALIKPLDSNNIVSCIMVSIHRRSHYYPEKYNYYLSNIDFDYDLRKDAFEHKYLFYKIEPKLSKIGFTYLKYKFV